MILLICPKSDEMVLFDMRQSMAHRQSRLLCCLGTFRGKFGEMIS